MIIVTGTIEVAAEGIEAARAGALAVMQETRKEAGCRLYVFSQLVESETTFRVYEEWDSLADLEAHFQTPHMAAWREVLTAAGLKDREVYRIDGGEKTRLA